MRIFLNILFILACVCATAEAIRFCVWADKYASGKQKIKQDKSAAKTTR